MKLKIIELVFATNNQNKIEEIIQAISNRIIIRSLEDISCIEEIPETSPTIEGNAIQKAQYIYNNYKVNCFADDTGLEVSALDGRPGVKSARYAGESRNFDKNIDKILYELTNKPDRSARFRTVIALIINGELTTFEGIINGRIINERRGDKGFGYDPIFIPEGYSKTFAEMNLSEKNKISHRAIAIRKLIDFLLQ